MRREVRRIHGALLEKLRQHVARRPVSIVDEDGLVHEQVEFGAALDLAVGGREALSCKMA